MITITLGQMLDIHAACYAGQCLAADMLLHEMSKDRAHCRDMRVCNHPRFGDYCDLTADL